MTKKYFSYLQTTLNSRRVRNLLNLRIAESPLSTVL